MLLDRFQKAPFMKNSPIWTAVDEIIPYSGIIYNQYFHHSPPDIQLKQRLHSGNETPGAQRPPQSLSGRALFADSA
jgi:hypothetical protein